MAPTTDDLRALLDERVAPDAPARADAETAARLSGVRGRVRRARARRAAAASALAVALCLGGAGVTGALPGRGDPAVDAAAGPVGPQGRSASGLPGRDVEGKPLAARASVTAQTRFASVTVVPRSLRITFAATCTGDPASFLVLVNGRQFVDGDRCHDEDRPGSSMSRSAPDWGDDPSVAVGKLMTIDVLLVEKDDAATGADPRPATGDLTPRTVDVGVYGDLTVVPGYPLRALPERQEGRHLLGSLSKQITKDFGTARVTVVARSYDLAIVHECVAPDDQTAWVLFEVNGHPFGATRCGPTVQSGALGTSASDPRPDHWRNLGVVVGRPTKVTVRVVGLKDGGPASLDLRRDLAGGLISFGVYDRLGGG